MFFLVCFFPPDSQDCFRCQKYFGSSSQRVYCIPLPEELLAFSDPMAITLLAFASLGNAMTLALSMTLLWCDKQSTSNKINALLLFAVSISFASSWTFAGKPLKRTCQIRKPLASFSITLTTSCLMSIILHLCRKSGGKVYKRVCVCVCVCVCVRHRLTTWRSPSKQCYRGIRYSSKCCSGRRFQFYSILL